MRNRKVLIYLSGGLGNQMFQYAFGRAISIKDNIELILDTRSGFLIDRTFKREYELEKFNLDAKTIGIFESLPFWLYKLNSYFKKIGFEGYIKSLINVVTEDYVTFVDFKSIAYLKDTCFVGYWQNPRYFSEISNVIFSELYPPLPASVQVTSLGKQMRESNSLAICLRFYEETTSPESLSSTGEVKSLVDIRNVLDNLKYSIEEYKVYLFCTHIPEDIGILKLPIDVTYVTPNYGYNDAVESLWLIAQCKNHIIMNSTFYWWGTYLSICTHNQNPSRETWCADNFLNPSCVLDSWNSF